MVGEHMGKIHSINAGRETVFIGGIVGLLPSLVLGTLLFVNQEPGESESQIFGKTVFAIFYVSPYLMALMLSRTRDPATRGALVLTVALLSMGASFTSVAGITFILLPATFILLVGAARSLRHSGQRILPLAGLFFAGLMGAVAIGFSFVVLFWLNASEEPGRNIVTNQEALVAAVLLGAGITLFAIAGTFQRTTHS